MVCKSISCASATMCQYNLRFFYSKGAFVVLFWTFLLFCVSICLFDMKSNELSLALGESKSGLVFVIPFVVGLILAPLSGWLADAKLGNYLVFRIGCIFLFISAVLSCFTFVIKGLFSEPNKVLVWTLFIFDTLCLIVGAGMSATTVLPLGLDQMPDASSSNISSFISWFVCICFGSIFVTMYFSPSRLCFISDMFPLVVSLILPFCVAIVLIIQYFIPQKWLIIEPKSPQSLKIIYQVLAFAWNHKSPLNRSALTYWEEDVPSRLDLGKSRYGGPFTTEQVEDVKTVFRLIVLSIPSFFVIFSISMSPNVLHYFIGQIQNLDQCASNAIYSVTYNPVWCGIIVTVIFELFVYPVRGRRFSKLLKQIGFASVTFSILCFLCLFIKLLHRLDYFSEVISEWIVRLLYHVIFGIINKILCTAMLEFVCAQSPYSMRGLVISFGMIVALVFSSVGHVFGYVLYTYYCQDQNTWCSIVPFSVMTVISLLALALFVPIAYWYKMRVRDDNFDHQRIVEEVYDRYLTAETARIRNHATV